MLPVPRHSQFRTSRPERFETVRRNIDRVCDAVNNGDGELSTEITEIVQQAPVSLSDDDLNLCLDVDLLIISNKDIERTLQLERICPLAQRPPPC